MNSEIKRHIDSARQVLVGVVPNPTSQIDQITNALIYKFMDDMDQASIKAGGKPSFFVGELEKYSWTVLMGSRLGNQERMNLYGEALTKFSQSEKLPELFREIFKSAFLPYRSPEVLGLFLKEIDYFDYAHPEDLGDAYEYLLSIMSSQGDAGQFRTPRHIIDFIVDVVNPTKDDKILDPACGTAGFLISAFKHILSQHDGKDDTESKEKELTPDQRKTLMSNLYGYDVDPGMVRIAQVNMYLHGFKNPKIFQYDTLAMEERWNDKFDVILANPPFMSPKGGVRPHRKFGVESNRSEVLFVDYIMNHLRPKGRAGIIVPEGIIFQSGKAYKQLRKNLLNDGLFAVVSLPSGVFNPYAGVKTSILLLDNELAKTTKEILFLKIDNDGFGLGAQRRASAKDDLPTALDVLNRWKTGEKIENKLSLYIEKSKIAENDAYNLSGDRYRVATDYSNAKWPMVKLEDVFIEIKNGKNVTQLDKVGKYRVSRIQTISTGEVNLEKTKYTNDEVAENDFLQEGDILFSHINSIDHLGKTAIIENVNEKVVHGANLIRLRADKDRIIPKYALFVFKSEEFIITARSFAQKAVNQASINTSSIKNFNIPLPPLEIQDEIVKELDGYQKIIDGAKQISENWKPKIDTDLEWEKVRLGEVCRIERGASPRPIDKFMTKDSNGLNWVKIGDTKNSYKYITNTKEKVTREGAEKSRKVLVGDFVLSNSMSFGRPYIMKIDGYIHDGWLRLSEDIERVGKDYLYYILSSSIVMDQFEKAATGGVVRNLNSELVRNVIIPLPSLTIQKQIVTEIEAERELVESAKKLVGIYEGKTKEVIDKLWEE